MKAFHSFSCIMLQNGWPEIRNLVGVFIVYLPSIVVSAHEKFSSLTIHCITFDFHASIKKHKQESPGRNHDRPTPPNSSVQFMRGPPLIIFYKVISCTSWPFLTRKAAQIQQSRGAEFWLVMIHTEKLPETQDSLWCVLTFAALKSFFLISKKGLICIKNVSGLTSRKTWHETATWRLKWLGAYFFFKSIPCVTKYNGKSCQPSRRGK